MPAERGPSGTGHDTACPECGTPGAAYGTHVCYGGSVVSRPPGPRVTEAAPARRQPFRIRMKPENKDAEAWERLAVSLGKERDAYRIEADCAMRDHDGLMVDAGIMYDALRKIAEKRPNKPFDPWASELARDTLTKVSEQVTDAA